MLIIYRKMEWGLFFLPFFKEVKKNEKEEKGRKQEKKLQKGPTLCKKKGFFVSH